MNPNLAKEQLGYREQISGHRGMQSARQREYEKIPGENRQNYFDENSKRYSKVMTKKPVMYGQMLGSFPALLEAMGATGAGGALAQTALKSVSTTSKMAKAQQRQAYGDKLGVSGKAMQTGNIAKLASRSYISANMLKTLATGVGGPSGTLTSMLGAPVGLGLAGLQVAGGIATSKKIKKLRAQRQSTSQIEKNTSLSSGLEGYYNNIVNQGQMQAADQLQVRTQMWIEAHTSVIPLIYDELQFLRQEKEKGVTNLEEQYSGMQGDGPEQGVLGKSLDAVETSLMKLIGKFDPITQLTNFFIGGFKSPQQFLDEIGKTNKETFKDKLFEKQEAKATGIQKDELRLIGVSSQSLIAMSSSYEEKMMALAMGQFDVARLMGKELITIRKHGFGIAENRFRDPMVDEEQSAFGKMFAKMSNTFMNIPGLNAVANIVKTVTTAGSSFSNMFTSVLEKGKHALFGSEYLELQDKEAADKAAGIYQSIDEKMKNYIARGLPTMMEDLRNVNTHQLETQQNIYDIAKQQYQLLYAQYTGEQTDVEYQETQKDKKERRIWDTLSNKYLDPDTFAKAIDAKQEAREFAREQAWSKGAMGKFISPMMNIFRSTASGIGDFTTGRSDNLLTSITNQMESRDDQMRRMGDIINKYENITGDFVYSGEEAEEERASDIRSAIPGTKTFARTSIEEQRARINDELLGGQAKAFGRSAKAGTGAISKLVLGSLLGPGGLLLGGGMALKDLFKFQKGEVGRQLDFEAMGFKEHGMEGIVGRHVGSAEEEAKKRAYQGEYQPSNVPDLLSKLSKQESKGSWSDKLISIFTEFRTGFGDFYSSWESYKDEVLQYWRRLFSKTNENRAPVQETFKYGKVKSFGDAHSGFALVGEDPSGGRLTGSEEIVQLTPDGVSIIGQENTRKFFDAAGVETVDDFEKQYGIAAATGARFKRQQKIQKQSEQEKIGVNRSSVINSILKSQRQLPQYSGIGMKSQLSEIKEEERRNRYYDYTEEQLEYLRTIADHTKSMKKGFGSKKDDDSIFGLLSNIGTVLSGSIVPFLAGGGAIATMFMSGGKIGTTALTGIVGHLTKKMFDGFGYFLKTTGDDLFGDIFAKLAGGAGKISAKIGINSIAKYFGQFGSKLLETLGLGGLTKIFGKQLAGTTTKGIGKSLAKKIPFLGALVGTGFAVNRMKDGDWLGAAMEFGSGMASIVPGIGTAVSIGVDSMIAIRDMKTTEEERSHDLSGISELFTKTGAKLLEKFFGKKIMAMGAKGILGTLGKKIPGVGVLVGGGFAIKRFLEGDWIGGLAELGSGLASIVPGVGTGISLGIDSWIAFRDMNKPKDPNEDIKNVNTDNLLKAASKNLSAYERDDLLSKMKANMSEDASILLHNDPSRFKTLVEKGIITQPYTFNNKWELSDKGKRVYQQVGPDISIEKIKNVNDKIQKKYTLDKLRSKMSDSAFRLLNGDPNRFQELIDKELIYESTFGNEYRLSKELKSLDKTSNIYNADINELYRKAQNRSAWLEFKSTHSMSDRVEKLVNRDLNRFNKLKAAGVITFDQYSAKYELSDVLEKRYEELGGLSDKSVGDLKNMYVKLKKKQTLREMRADMTPKAFKLLNGEPSNLNKLVDQGVITKGGLWGMFGDYELTSVGESAYDKFKSGQLSPKEKEDLIYKLKHKQQLKELKGVMTEDAFKLLNGDPTNFMALVNNDKIEKGWFGFGDWQLTDKGEETLDKKAKTTSKITERDVVKRQKLSRMREDMTEDAFKLLNGDPNRLQRLIDRGDIERSWFGYGDWQVTDRGKASLDRQDLSEFEKIENKAEKSRRLRELEKIMTPAAFRLLGGDPSNVIDLKEKGHIEYSYELGRYVLNKTKSQTQALNQSGDKTNRELAKDGVKDITEAQKKRRLKRNQTSDSDFFSDPIGRAKKEIDALDSTGVLSQKNFSKKFDTIKKKLKSGSEILAKGKHHIISNEGISLKKYKDSLGNPTIGVGHLIESGEAIPSKISLDSVYDLFETDYSHHKKMAKKVPGFNQLGKVGQQALIDLTFNMGPNWHRKFPKMIDSLKAGKRKDAADQLLDSAYAEQVGDRAVLNAKLIETGDPRFFNTNKPQVIARHGAYTGKGTGAINAILHHDEIIMGKGQFGQFLSDISTSFTRDLNLGLRKLVNGDVENRITREKRKLEQEEKQATEKQKQKQNEKPINNESSSPTIIPVDNSTHTQVTDPSNQNEHLQGHFTPIDKHLDAVIDNLFNTSSLLFERETQNYVFDSSVNHHFQ